MHRSITSFVLIAGVLALFLAGCGSAPQAAPTSPGVAATAAQPPAATSVPATAPAASLTDPATTASTATGSDPANTIRLVIVPDKSEARYRVREQLASLSLPSDAIGKTSDITGAIVGKPDGTIIPSESKFVVNVQSLQSDRSQRDGFLRRNTLQSDQYPNAVFVAKSTSGLATTLPPANPTTFKLTGDLTIRDVTKEVTWDVTCQPQGSDQGMCHATTTFTFEYFNLNQPRVPVVLSVEDHITLELDAFLQKLSSK